MKLRNGFVSNSSTSSYVIITTQESYDKIMTQLSELERGAVKAEFSFSKEKVCGEDRIVATETICTEDLGYDWDFLPEDSECDSKEFEEAYEGLDKFVRLIGKEKDSFIKEFD